MKTILQLLANVQVKQDYSSARKLEKALDDAKYKTLPYGKRENQLSSVKNASNSSVAFRERYVNCVDASLEEACRIKGYPPTTCFKEAVDWFGQGACRWSPEADIAHIKSPIAEINFKIDGADHRFKKIKPEKYCNLVFTDHAGGLTSEEMIETILHLNSSHKSKMYMMTGQYGHGGAVSFDFCDITLIWSVSRKRNCDVINWTLVRPERDPDSKLSLTYKYFVDTDNLPFRTKIRDIPCEFPISDGGTIVAHFAFNCDGWIRLKQVGGRDSYHYGRIGGEFFSYPLPVCVLNSDGLYSDLKKSGKKHPITGSYWRLKDNRDVVSLPEEKFELMYDGEKYGSVIVNVFYCSNNEGIVGFGIPKDKPIIYTYHGIRHGSDTIYFLKEKTELPEVHSKLIVEIRLDGVDTEARNMIFDNSREQLKDTFFTKYIRDKMLHFIKNNEFLQKKEMELEAAKSSFTNEELNEEVTKDLADLLEGDIVCTDDGEINMCSQGTELAAGGSPARQTGTRQNPPPMPHSNPPTMIEFYGRSFPTGIHQGGRLRIKYRTDARGPLYTFQNGLLRVVVSDTVSVTSHSEISSNGYGSVEISCTSNAKIGTLANVGISLDVCGRKIEHIITLEVIASVVNTPVGKERPKTTFEVNFYCPDGEDPTELKALLGGNEVMLGLPPEFAAFENLKITPSYDSMQARGKIFVNINAAFPELVQHLRNVSVQERRHRVLEITRDCAYHAAQRHLKMGMPDDTFNIMQDSERALVDNYRNLRKAVKLQK